MADYKAGDEVWVRGRIYRAWDDGCVAVRGDSYASEFSVVVKESQLQPYTPPEPDWTKVEPGTEVEVRDTGGWHQAIFLGKRNAFHAYRLDFPPSAFAEANYYDQCRLLDDTDDES